MKFKALIVAASMAAFLPVSASALSVKIFNSIGEIAEINDGGAGDLASATAGTVITLSQNIGGYNGVSATLSIVDGFPPLDDFSSNFDIAAGDGYLRFEVTHEFDNGLPTPTTGRAGTTTNLLGLADTATASSSIYLGAAAYDRGTLLSSASGSGGSHVDLVAVTGSPYWITSVFEISGQLTQSGTANAEFAAPVPVPAGILLMGTAIAGFGVMRRRKQRA